MSRAKAAVGATDVAASNDDVESRIRRELEDLSPVRARDALIGRLVGLTAEMARLREMQQILLTALRARDVAVQHTAAIPAARFIELSPRDSFSAGSGFREIGWDRDVAFRWTGPGHDSVLRVWLDRSMPMVMEVALLSYGDARNRAAIGLSVDGAPVALAEAGENLLRSAPFPLLPGSLYSEVALHVPFLSHPDAPKRGKVAMRDEAAARGIAFTQLRFLAAA